MYVVVARRLYHYCTSTSSCADQMMTLSLQLMVDLCEQNANTYMDCKVCSVQKNRSAENFEPQLCLESIFVQFVNCMNFVWPHYSHSSYVHVLSMTSNSSDSWADVVWQNIFICSTLTSICPLFDLVEQCCSIAAVQSEIKVHKWVPNQLVGYSKPFAKLEYKLLKL